MLVVGAVGIAAAPSPPTAVVFAAGVALAYATLVGVHLRERRRYGWLGWAGFSLISVGIPFVVIYVGLAMIPLGVVLMGIAVARRSELPRAPAVLLALSAAVVYGGFSLGAAGVAVPILAFLVAIAWLGAALWRSPQAPIESDSG